MSIFEQLLPTIKGRSHERISVAAATDPTTLHAVSMAREQGLADAILFGDKNQIRATLEQENLDLGDVAIHHVDSPAEAALMAAETVRNEQATVMMKGYVHSSDYLRAVFNRERGLRGNVHLSHTFVLDATHLGRLVLVTDGAINITPDLATKAQIVSNAVDLAHKLDIERPKVAVLSAVAAVKPTMTSTLEAAALSQMARRNQVKECDIDGPLALDNAVSPVAAKYKKIDGPVAGHADILLIPDVVTGNILSKSLPFLAGGRMAGLVLGAIAPVVLPSRADSAQDKLMAIALAVKCAMTTPGNEMTVQKVHF